MYFTWLLTRYFSANGVVIIVLILAGIIGFAIGTLIFWRFSLRHAELRSAQK